MPWSFEPPFKSSFYPRSQFYPKEITGNLEAERRSSGWSGSGKAQFKRVDIGFRLRQATLGVNCFDENAQLALKGPAGFLDFCFTATNSKLGELAAYAELRIAS